MALGVNMLAVDPRQSEIVYAATTKGLFRSTDQAEHWTEIGQGLSNQFVSALAPHPTDPNILYIGGLTAFARRSTEGKPGSRRIRADDTEHPHYQYQPEQPRGALSRHQRQRTLPIHRWWAELGTDSPDQSHPNTAQGLTSNRITYAKAAAHSPWKTDWNRSGQVMAINRFPSTPTGSSRLVPAPSCWR